jgi:pyruvate kinase
MRKTKIICTLGPATEKPETIRQLIARGADVFRINMSHAPREWVRKIVPRIRKLAQESGRPIGVLLDTQGPAIRTGPVKTPLELKKGDVLEFTVGHAKKTEKKSVEVNYDKFANDVNVGDTVLVDNGLISSR